MVVLYQHSSSSQYEANKILYDLDALVPGNDCLGFITRFQAKLADYNQFVDINFHDTVKIQKLQAAFRGNKELTGEIAWDRKNNRTTARVNEFAYFFNELKDAAACLDAVNKHLKLQSQSTSSCTTPHTVNHTNVGDDVGDSDGSAPDNMYPFDHLEAMFLIIDISLCDDPCTIMGFAAHQQQHNFCQVRPHCPCDPTTWIDNDVYNIIPDSWKDCWCSTLDTNKCAYT